MSMCSKFSCFTDENCGLLIIHHVMMFSPFVRGPPWLNVKLFNTDKYIFYLLAVFLTYIMYTILLIQKTCFCSSWWCSFLPLYTTIYMRAPFFQTFYFEIGRIRTWHLDASALRHFNLNEQPTMLLSWRGYTSLHFLLFLLR